MENKNASTSSLDMKITKMEALLTKIDEQSKPQEIKTVSKNKKIAFGKIN